MEHLVAIKIITEYLFSHQAILSEILRSIGSLLGVRWIRQCILRIDVQCAIDSVRSQQGINKDETQKNYIRLVCCAY